MTEVQKSKVVLISYVWPELRSSAAGLRTTNLIDLFLSEKWDVCVASPSQLNSYSEELTVRGVKTQQIHANDSRFDDWIRAERPELVIFDRFVIEEQFGWRVFAQCPQAIRILDTQDLHFLRRTRAHLVQQGMSLVELQQTKLNWDNDDTFREIASIYRCDGVWVLSSDERELLIRQFDVDPEVVSLSRFRYPEPPPPQAFQERSNFMMIGNFRHLPNLDAVFWLVHDIWPQIRARLEGASLNIYGAYPPREVMKLTHPETGFFVRGPTPDQFEALSQHRVNLAPLRFGAGIKGKISDSWWSGTPVVTTSIGAEGMIDSKGFPGCVADQAQALAEAAVRVYQDQLVWENFQRQGQQVITEFYNADQLKRSVIDFVRKARFEVTESISILESIDAQLSHLEK